MFFSRKYFTLLYFFSLIFACSQVTFAGDNDWREITPAELQMKTAKVEADADAEAIFWEISIDDSSSDELSMKHYIRVKIYTERGSEKDSKVDLHFSTG